MSGKLPRLRIERAEQWQRERLTRWLAEWEIERELPLEGGAITWQGRSEVGTWPVAPLEAEPPVVAGQIRLLSPEVPVARDRPLFFAILSEQGARSFVVAPYSRFAEPAFPGELLTGRDAPPLRVLCAWNARAMAGWILEKSWLVDELSAREMDEASGVLRHLRDGAKLPAGIERRMGPPLWHPADPRMAYKREETAMMAALVSDAEAGGISGTAGGSPLVYPTGGHKLSLAAEPRAKYETKQRRQPKGRGRKTREKGSKK